MKNHQRLFAWLMTVIMLLGMVTTAQAAGCTMTDTGRHDLSWRRPNGDAPDCRTEVVVEQYCTKCGEVTWSGTEQGPCVPGDQWVWDSTPPANCMEAAIRNQLCKYCGMPTNEREESGPHSWRETIVEEPWCDVGGMKAVICSVCGEWQNNGTPLNPLGHDWGSWSWAHGSAPSCIEGAWQVRNCNRCGQMEDQWVAAGSHQWGSWNTVSAGNCQTPAKEQRSCSVCGATENRDGGYGNHSWGDWYRAGVPTCTERGLMRRNCSICGRYETDPIPMVDHAFGEWYVVVEAQVGLPGLEQRDCTYGCGTFEQREIPALEQDFGDDPEAPVALPGLSLTLKLTSTPANGQYFVVGEEVVFTEYWANNSSETLFPFYVSIWTYPEPVADDRMEILCSWDAEVPVAPGASGSHQLVTTVTETDVARGGIHARALISAGEHEGPYLEEVTTPFVTAPCGAGEVDLDGLTVTKSAAKGSHMDYYYPGEEVLFTITVTNNTGVELLDVEITDPLKGSNEDAVVDRIASMQPGESVTVTFNYITTDADAAIGTESFENTAYATGYTADGTQVNGTSNTVRVWCVIQHEVGFSKSVVNTPANGEYFVPGETIEFAIHMTNDTPYPLYSITLTDPLCKDQYIYDEINDMSYLYFDSLYRDGNPMGYSSSASVNVKYVVTEADAEAGSVTNTAHLWYQTWYGEEKTASASATAKCGKASNAVILEKIDMRSPANGEYYVPGEVIKYGLTVRSTEDNPLQNIMIYDPLKGGDQVVFGPADAWVLGAEFHYTVTEADAQRGYIENTGYATFTYQNTGEEDRIESNTLTLPCGEVQDTGLSGAISFTKGAAAAPQNGMYYVPGESIRYQFALYNWSNVTLKNITFVDPLIGSGSWDQLAPNEFKIWECYYEVTEIDAMAGSVENIAYVNAFDEADNQYVEYSNPVSVPCGFPEGENPFGVLTGLEITKEVESLPLNGSYYTEGETVAYKITYTNIGEMPLTDVMIYDAMGGMSEIATAEMLNPSESRVCWFNHTVTADDVNRGYISNTAIGQFELNGYVNTVNSNTVTVDTDGKQNIWTVHTFWPGEDPEYDPSTGWFPGGSSIPEGENPPFGTIDTNALHSGETYCVRTITGRDNVSVSYETSFCAEHADTQASVLMMNQAGTTPEMQMQAAAYAVALWRSELEKLYQEIYEASDPTAKVVVMTEYVRFLTEVANYEAMLKVLYPDQPALAATKVAAMWENKCIDLCYDAHAAAAERKDSLLAVTPATGAAAGNCTCEVTAQESGKKTSVQSYCAVHGFPFSMIDALLQGSDTAEAWTMVRQIWGVELTNSYNKIYTAMGENKLLAMAEYNALTQWMMAREASLIALYPENPEIVVQVMVKTIMERVNDLCQMAQ